MTEYLDCLDVKIKQGFYKHDEYNLLVYFTGKYNIEEVPIFEIEGDSKKRYSLPAPIIQHLSRIDNEKVKEEMKGSKERASWVEKIIKEAELSGIDSKTK